MPDENMLVLASASPARAKVLASAGLRVTIDAPNLDEASVKGRLAVADSPADEAAVTLAEAKALKVAERHPDAWVIGADQMLECEGRWFDKPNTIDEARRQLKALRGKTHRLHAGVCVVRKGEVIWDHVETGTLTMRDFSDEFLEYYLESEGDGVCTSVGGYLLEGLGIQLFQTVSGCHFTILGLPLLPLLCFLRGRGVLEK